MHFYHLSKLLAVSLLAQILIAYFISPWALVAMGIVSVIYLMATSHSLVIDEPEQPIEPAHK